MKQKLIALLSALSILLLAACGVEEDTSMPDSVVYVPQFVDCRIGESIWRGCTDGQSIYCAGDTSLFHISLEDGAAEKLENYAPPSEESTIGGIQSAGDGVFWVMEPGQETTLLRRLDNTGTEMERLELPGYIESAAIDQAGNIYEFTWDAVTVLDKDQNQLFELECADMWGGFIQMADGSIALSATCSNPETYANSFQLRCIDLEHQCWGTVYELSGDMVEVFPGGGDYLFYYINGDSVYGWKTGASESERLFSLLDAGLDSVRFLTFLADGRAVALTSGSTGASMAILTPTDASTLPEKTTLTMAAVGLDSGMRNQILAFNRSSSTCRIEVTDYGEYNTSGDVNLGLMKLNTELLAGNMPDLFYTPNLPIARYAGKGFLEDLWPYIDADGELGGREAFMERVLDAASINGKLYEAFSGFAIHTAAAPAAVVGERVSWTLADLREIQSTMPEDSTVFGPDYTQAEALFHILRMNMDRFVNWEEGQCSFDSAEFQALLAFCADFPAKIPEEMTEGEFTRIAKGKQLLVQDYIIDFTNPQYMKKMLGGDISFIGYPKEDGSAGSFFDIGSGCAMSSACKDKDAAWTFLRRLFLPGAGQSNSFPINKSDFEQMREDSLREHTEALMRRRDSKNQIIEIFSVTQEEAAQIMALYENINSVGRTDDSIYEIVRETASMYFAGDKPLDAAVKEIQDRVQLYMGENL